MTKLAIVEDDPAENARLLDLLSLYGECRGFADARSFLAAFEVEAFDLACIDWELPDRPGPDLIREIRAGVRNADMPIILITARGQDDDLVVGLAAGADDFLAKPIRNPVFLARIEAMLRRVRPRVAGAIERFDQVAFEPARMVVTTPWGEVSLGAREFKLALILFRNLDRPLARGFLVAEVWGPAAAESSRTLDALIGRLRTRLGLRPANGYQLHPVQGFGYRLERVPPLAAPARRSA